MNDLAQPRVGIYVPHGQVPDVRGFSPAIIAWNHAVRLARFEPLVISAAEDRPCSQTNVEGIAIKYLKTSALYRRLFHKWTRLDPLPLHRRAARVARAAHADVFHAHQLEFLVNDFRRAAGFSIPVIVHAHVTARRFDPARGVADRYVAVSEYVRHTLANSQGYPPERIEVIPNGVDTSIFRPAPEEEQAAVRDRLGIPREATVVLFAGRRQEIKGFDTFLAVADALVPRGDNLFFVSIGPEPRDATREPSFPLRQRLREKLRRSGRYLELDPLPHPELATVFRAADVLLAPSRAEPQGMVMIEGMASGLIVISTAVGGIKESIRHGVTGLLLEDAADTATVTHWLEAIVNQPEAFLPMRAAARAEVERRFAWDVVVEKLEALYGSVLAG